MVGRVVSFETLVRALRSACALAATLGCAEDAPAPNQDSNATSSDAGASLGSEPRVEELSAREAIESGSPSCQLPLRRCSDFGEERPPRTSEHSAVYDPGERAMWVFGGTSSVPVDCAPSAVEFLQTLWRYDDPCGRWQEVESRGPSPRARHVATFGAGRMWLFGGRFREGTGGYYQLYYDLWAFDPTTNQWQRMPTGDERPTARVNAALTFDAARSRLWLMGGNQSEHAAIYLPTNDVWSYSLEEEQWHLHNTSVGPAPRFFHAATIDAERDRLLVFGGADAEAFSEGLGYFGDLWALELESLSWRELSASADGPDGRFSTQLVHDEAQDAYVVFGGHDDGMLGNRNDTWRFDPVDEVWSPPATEDTLGSPAIDSCSFPPDFARVVPELPERRHSHTLVWSPRCEHALLFGGKTDCGAADDVWRWTRDSWNVRVPAREGEVCERWSDDPTQCSALCY